MNVPRLEIYLNEKMELCFAKVESSEVEPRLVLGVDLKELRSFGLEGAEKRVGTAILKMMTTLYKEPFKTWDVSTPVDESQTEKYDLGMQLMHLSISTKTSVHVPSIDILFQEQNINDESMRKMIEENWPTIRERLVSYGSEDG
ncbi:hypothetical protein ACIPF8_12315 [Collimonas sp. NPDC087041]|uniref:hypothetical protein n=1 Tax=Collimonas sp. NPDC087041 TaxID=3363960 RepID=UPI00382206DA